MPLCRARASLVTTDPPPELARLRELLHASTAPLEVRAELRQLRLLLAGSEALAAELVEAEARWLLQLAARRQLRGENTTAAAAAVRALRARNCQAAPPTDVDALFELAATAAELDAVGERLGATALREVLRERAGAVTDVAALCQEADERWAAQGGGDDDRPLRVQAAVLRGTAALLQDLSIRTKSRQLRRRARRSRCAADDLELAARLESLLRRRFVVAMETTSFVLLLLVVLVLVLQSTFHLSDSALRATNAIDAVAGCWFVLEFALKLALAPRRASWFWRNALTDLLPAIPAVLFLLPAPSLPGGAEDAVVMRILRLFRVTWAARYLQALRPLLRSLRLVLMLVRGMDGTVRRFRDVLDRTFVFLAAPVRESVAVETRRDVLFAALRREQTLFAALPAEAQDELLRLHLADVTERACVLQGHWSEPDERRGSRDIAVDAACEFLWTLRPHDVERYLRPADVRSIDRVVRVLRIPPIGWLPILRNFRVRQRLSTPEERIVAFGRLIADWLMSWQERLQFFADLHGIVTGPQILDRVASAMVKASQRPAVRLLLFGGLFAVLNLFWEENCLSKVVGLPLLLLGSVCLVLLVTGWWLKRIAGDASETFRLTSEAHFVALLLLVKQRHEDGDIEFLARRTIGDAAIGDTAGLLRHQLKNTRAGVPVDVGGFDEREEQLASRVALLYLHFLGGALLHETDVKTTEQLLANLALEDLRHAHLGFTRKDKKRLRRLRLDEGSVLRGPFLWFRFITESIAVETSKRILEYNRRCVPLAERSTLTPARERALTDWLLQRCDSRAGRTIERLQAPSAGARYGTTEFHALHFLTADPERDAHVEAVFGSDVLRALRADRRNMVRSIFGMREAQELAGSTRTFNAWRTYWSRLSHGRVMLMPILLPARAVRLVSFVIARVRQIVREVLVPQLEMKSREVGIATFSVALRKIHRMKAPSLLEAIRMRIDLDPAYSGAASSFSSPEGREPVELQRDLDFLLLHERERATFLSAAERNREHVALLHAALQWLPAIGDENASVAARNDGELAVTTAWITDRDRVRTLTKAEAFRVMELPGILAGDDDVSLSRRGAWWVRDLFSAQPIDRWLVQQRIPATRRGRRRLRRAYVRDANVRGIVDAWNELGGSADPVAAAVERMRAIWLGGAELRRQLVSLRAIQSLSVLDVRNYRDLVFELGGYAEDGEDPSLARDLP